MSYDRDELPVEDQMNSIPQAVLYPNRYKKNKYIQINRIDGSNDVVVQIWDNNAEDTRFPVNQIRMTIGEAIDLFDISYHRLVDGYDERGRSGNDLIVEPTG